MGQPDYGKALDAEARVLRGAEQCAGCEAIDNSRPPQFDPSTVHNDGTYPDEGAVKKSVSAADLMERAQQTFIERGKVYGHAGFVEHGEVLLALFPEGLTLTTPEEFSRFVLFNNLLTKFCRYARNFKKGGHADSIHDIGVYAFILEAFDENRHNGR